MLFAPKGGAQHMGIYYGQDADNKPMFYGSQTSTGPAVFSMAPLSPKEPAYFNTDNLVGVLRPKTELYVPEMDLTGGSGTGLSSGHVMAAVNLLKSSNVEGYRPHIYSDNEKGSGDGVPTVGNGFALVVKGTNGWTIRPENEIKDLLRDAGLPESRYSELPMEKLQQSANFLNKGDMLAARNVFGMGKSDTGFGLSEADADKLTGSFVIREVIPRTLKAVGGAENFAEFSDGEFAAVASKTYQSPGWLNSTNGKNFLQAWSRGDDETAQALLGSGQRGKAEAQAYAGHIDSVNPNLNAADGNSPLAVSTNGHWEDTTQFDQQGNVTVTGERVWVSDRNKVDDSKTVNADESARPSSSSKELLIASKQIDLPAGDSVEGELPDGTRVVSTSTTVNGQTTVTAQLFGPDGRVLLSAGAGQTMERDPDTGIVQVRTGTSDHVQQFDPASGEVSEALRTGSEAAHVYQNLLESFANPQMSNNEGTQLVDASGGLPEASKQAMGDTFSNYLETQGVSKLTQAQASAMFNSLMAVNNWDHMSDVGKLSALVNLYNATDKLGEAFGATGDNLPSDLDAAAGYLQLVQGIQSGDSLIIANGINVLSEHALDNATNAAFGNTAAGEAVPYLSYALAIRNFADNPEQAMLTAADSHLDKAANDAHFRKAA